MKNILFGAAFLLAILVLACPSRNGSGGGNGWLTHRGSGDNRGVLPSEGPENLDLSLWKARGESAFWGGAAVTPDAVFVAEQNGHLHRFNRETGKEEWKTLLGPEERVTGTPLLDAGRNLLYAGSDTGKVFAVDAGTGQPRWTASTGGPAHASLRMWKGRVYAACMDNVIYAFNAEDGSLDWSFESPEGEGIAATPALRDGRLYYATMAFNKPNALLAALDLEKRELLWQLPIFGYAKAAPAVDDTAVYVATGGYYVIAADRRTGAELWRFKAENAVNADPAVDEEHVYAGSRDGRVYAIDKKTGAKAWDYYIDGWFESGLLVDGRHVYAGSSEGTFFVFDKARGEEAARFTAHGSLYAGPAFFKGNFYVGDADGFFYALAGKAEKP